MNCRVLIINYLESTVLSVRERRTGLQHFLCSVPVNAPLRFACMNDDFSLTSLSLVVKLHPCLEASPDGRPLTEKQRCSGSYRRAVSFQVFKDDSISQRPSLRRLRSRSTVHARRNLPVKEFCYLRTVNLTAAMCRQVNGKVQDST
jgi:hypothetical protein